MYPAQTRDESRGEQNNDLMEEVLSRQNMLKALRSVKKNKGAPGIDNLTVENLKPYLRQNWLSIREQLLKGENPGSKIPVNICKRACWISRSMTVGIPNSLFPPFGLGISTRKTG